MKTYSAKSGDIKRDWFVVDAEGLVLGRLASILAGRLRGKHKAMFTPHMDCGDHIVVVNAEKVVLTGNKEDAKMYRRHSGYPGGLKEMNARQLREDHPERLVEFAVKRMLPKNKLGRQLESRLKVYAGPNHPHEAQEPKVLTLQDKVG
jgi:large subunit ribosomal protein L13